MKITSEDLFEYWLIDMDDALDRFFSSFPAELRTQLDYSPLSLDVLEGYILRKYERPEEILPESEANTLDGAARYVGETFRKHLGGKWEIELDDPKYVYYGLPQISGFEDKPTPICPHTLVTASTDRRTGKFIRTVLENTLKRQKRSAQ